MVASHHFTRIDTLELKDLIYQKIGHQRAEKYFDQLKRFVGLKLSKVDFDKSCILTIGRENISLHNRLIRSIVQNACSAKIPPQKARKVVSGYQKNFSPVRRDRNFRERPSPLGPLGKSPSITCEETVSRIQQQQSGTELHSFCSRPPVAVEDGEEVEQFARNPSIRRWNSISAPLGVSINKSGARKSLYFGETCQRSGELPDTRSLRIRLEKKLASEGVGVSSDGANLLNNGLDVFLKRLIERFMGISGSNGEMISGFNRILPGKYAEIQRKPSNASMLDFRVAMELNPSILGEDWSIQLEKICNYALQ
ncbi:hypothetical protein DH2020_023952 [Rehmannia glutinosa]|uniref:Transcriptional coactivator Hfi1/Transcriptional adapter 1 n=1 Tax=Rehmannia glutinosa TaxID=99300 RepID=A0ABR0W991_REHGL